MWYKIYVGGDGSGDWDTTGSTVVINLQKDDVVSIQNMDINKTVWGHMYRVFTGYLLRAVYDRETVVGSISCILVYALINTDYN